MFSRLLAKLRALSNLPGHVDSQFGRLRRELREGVQEVRGTLKALKVHDIQRTLGSHDSNTIWSWRA